MYFVIEKQMCSLKGRKIAEDARYFIVEYLRDDVAQPLRLDEVEVLELQRRIIKVQ